MWRILIIRKAMISNRYIRRLGGSNGLNTRGRRQYAIAAFFKNVSAVAWHVERDPLDKKQPHVNI